MEPLFAQMQQFSTDLGRVMREAWTRMHDATEQVQRARQAQVEQLDAALDEATRWTKNAVAMGHALVDDYAKLALTTWRRAVPTEGTGTRE